MLELGRQPQNLFYTHSLQELLFVHRETEIGKMTLHRAHTELLCSSSGMNYEKNFIMLKSQMHDHHITCHKVSNTCETQRIVRRNKQIRDTEREMSG